MVLLVLFTFIPVSALDSESLAGCCIDTDEGLCTPFSEKVPCEQDMNGEWYADPFCNINGGVCKEGCCELDLMNFWVTQRTCEKKSELFGLTGNFREDVINEAACLGISESKKIGACIQEIGGNNVCAFTSYLECDSEGGIFKDGMLCSNEVLNSNCVKQSSIGCLEGRDEIYWYDSCGNPENIYSSDRDSSWNNGIVLPKEQSCNSNSDNSNSNSCGNCDYGKGSFCQVASAGDREMRDGEFTCKSRNCKNAPSTVDSKGEVLETKDRLLGESWCIYDGPIGDIKLEGVSNFSQDLVGSRHYRYICSEGKVEVDPCQDYRKEICVEKTTDDVSQAICRVNTWNQCLSANDEVGCDGECTEECLLKPDCRIHLVNIANNFKFAVCVPKFPPGFNIDMLPEESGSEEDSEELVPSGTSGETDGVDATEVCNLASATCKSTWKRKCPGGWTCTDNCECHTQEFTKKMNSFCVSLGDCGVYANLMGENISTGATIVKRGGKGRAPIQPALLGIAYMGLNLLPISIPASSESYDELDEILDPDSQVANPFPENFNDISAGGAGGISSDTTYGYMTFLPVLGWIIQAAVGCNRIKTVKITFNCEPAATAIPGSTCDDCDGGELKPCSRYKCESLSPLCKLINENTGEDTCIAMEDQDTDVIISPDKSVIDESVLSYEGITRRGFSVRTTNGECIDEFTPITFGIKTGAYSMCRLETTPEAFYSMNMLFEEQEVFLKSHSREISLPSIDSMIVDIIGDGEGEDPLTYQEAYDEIYNAAEKLTADMNLYVKCINLFGEETALDYKINFCVKPGPDTTAPVIKGILPKENSILKFGATEQDITVYLNEPADCKWGKVVPNLITPLENYNALPNTMDCSGESRDVSVGYYSCNTTLEIGESPNSFFIMCRDQPWLGENESRNIGEVYNYNLQLSGSNLKIDSISPSGKLIAGVSPTTVNLEVKTSEGGYEGKSSCWYAISKEGSENNVYTRFPITGDSSTHQSPGLQFVEGKNKIKVKCEDKAGNTAEKEGEITLELDTTAPIVARIFREGSGLNILTNEEAECYYNPKTCKFNIKEGESITTALSESHSVEWNPDVAYHIKCQDVWGNQVSGCSIVARPSDI